MKELDKGEDRISSLPDDMIHRILAFLEVGDAIRTSVLSNRWKLVWKTLPFLNFEYVPVVSKEAFARTVKHIFETRNQQCQVFNLKLHVDDVFTLRPLENIVRYAICHGVEDLSVRSIDCKCSFFDSNSLKKLSLIMDFDKPYFQFLNRWRLPALDTLYMEQFPPSQCYRRVPNASLSCLCSLTALTIVRVSLPASLDLPLLRTLILLGCELPENIWSLPCLTTLELIDLYFPSNFTDFLSALIHLENLKLVSSFPVLKDCVISCPQLINLELKTAVMAASFLTPNILVLSPSISNISVSGIFLMTCGVLELETVNIHMEDCILDKTNVPGDILKQYYCRLFPMLSGLGGAKILRIDLNTFEALSTVSNYLEHLPSPFYKLNSVKLPRGCKGSSISTALRKYLLGGTQGASIVTAVHQNIENHQVVPVSQTSQKVMLDEPLATPTKKLIDFQNIHKKVCADTVAKRVQVKHLVENSVVDAGRVRQAGASVAGTGIDQAVPVSLTSQKVMVDEPLNSVIDAGRVRQAGASVAGTGIDQECSSGGNSDFWAVPVSLTSQKVMVDESLAILNKELVESQDMRKKACVDTVETRVQVENMVENSGVDADRVRQVGSPVAGMCNVPVFKG